MADEWAEFQDVTPRRRQRAASRPVEQDEWAGFEEAAPKRPAGQPSRAPGRTLFPAEAMTPTGQNYDGDTFRLNTGGNARLYGADAFELNQTGQTRTGELLKLGQEAKHAFRSFAQPGAAIGLTGGNTYGRPVATVNNGGDAAESLLRDGMAIAMPEYLANDATRLPQYMEAERDARLNRRGAWQTSFEQPASFRHGEVDPWNPAASAAPGEAREAVFWDDPLPNRGLRPEVGQGYLAVWQDPSSKPADLLAYAKANGFTIDPAAVTKAYAERDKGRPAGGELSYTAAPKVLTDKGDGVTGAALRGFGDPFNVLDEAGAVVDSVVPGSGRESVWNSDRRFGDVYANNLDQNRSILEYDDAAHPYARFGGQLASGLVVPGASVEGVGFGAARAALRGGAGRYAAQQAARNAVVRRLGTAGAAEGAAAGIGQGEDWQSRATGGMIGTAAGAALGTLAGYAAPKVAQLVGRPFNKMAGAEGERAAGDFSDGAVDAARARASNDAAEVAEELPISATSLTPVARTRPSDPVSANTQPMDEASGLGPKSVLSFVPRTGEPGVSVVNEEGALATAVYRDEDGVARAAAQIPLTPEAAEMFDGASVYVAPELRRQGIATSLYDALEREGYPIGKQAGGGDLTPDGAGFVSAWRARGGAQAMENETPRPSIDGPVLSDGRARPLLDPASDDLRRRQAADLAARDVMPVPSNTVASMDEAERIAAGRMERVRAPDEADALERRTVPNAATGAPIPKRGPLDLVSWLRSQGGVRAQGGELQHYGIDNAPRKGMDFAGGEGRFGRLVANDGMTYDEAAERAWEAGFFPDHAERPTVAEFLDALSSTHSGRERAFRADDLPEVDAFETARRQRIEVEGAREAGSPLMRDRSEPIGPDDLDRNSPPVEAYEEWGENAPDFAGNIRLSNLDSPQSIARALVHTEARAGGFDAATRGRITQAETKQLASDLGMTADQLLKRRKGQAFNAEEALAARQILARSATDLVNMARRLQRVDNPGEELEASFRQSWLRHVAIQEQVAGMTAEAGRLLQQFRMTADSRDTSRVVASLGEGLGGAGRLKEVADQIVDLERAGVDAAGINQFTLRSLAARWKDKAIELYINSLLSGPQTHAVNMLSNTITALSQVPEHIVAASVGVARRTGERAVSAALSREVGDVDRVMFSEAGTRAMGLIAGTREGLRAAARSFLTGDTADAASKIEQQQMKAIGGKLGEVIRTPTRLLSAEDELFKGIASRMELNGLAMRRARSEGLTGKQARERAAELVANPDDGMLKGSFNYARYLTFQTPLEFDSLAAGVSRFSQRRPEVKLLLPFVRTPVNILKFAAERSPAALAMKSWRREFAAGGARRDLATARVLVGTGLGATMYEMALGGHITGGGPADREARRLLQADGWQPYSLRVGDTYYSYGRLDPFSTIIGTVADMVDLQSHMTDKQRERSMTLVAAAIANNLSSKTWLSGISSALEAVNDPDRYLDNLVSRTAGAIAVPAIAAQIARTTDPVMREARGPMDRIRSRIPGLSDDLLPRRDAFGRTVRSEGGVGPDIASPLWTGTAKNDPTIAALLSAGAGFSPPQRTYTVDGKRKEWTPAQYDRLQERSGTLAKSALDLLTASPSWKSMDGEERQDAVRDVMKDARGEAKADVLDAGLASLIATGTRNTKRATSADEWAGFDQVR